MLSYVMSLEVIQGSANGSLTVEGTTYTFTPVTLPNKVRIALKGNDSVMNLLRMRGTLTPDTVETYRAKNLSILKSFATDYFDIDSESEYDDKANFLAAIVHVYGSPVVVTKSSIELQDTNARVRDFSRHIHGTVTR